MQFRKRGFQKPEIECEGKATSLTSLKEGQCGTITQTIGGFGVTRRLAEMGLTPGTEVKILRKCNFHGPIEIEVRNVTLALGYGIASKIFVQPS